ncbi:hypothetical protein ACH4TE_04995 [Streptomyces sioyaensis]|uniref:hypothetical protein n=1 Tax=Streptomyces sioyaensis TaxID=67364 RepID=UPI0037BA098A
MSTARRQPPPSADGRPGLPGQHPGRSDPVCLRRHNAPAAGADGHRVAAPHPAVQYTDDRP